MGAIIRQLLLGRARCASIGTGVVRGFAWATATLRVAAEYDREDGNIALGEYAVEYLKRLSGRLRVVAAIEGDQDELEQITEARIFLGRSVFLKLNNSFGVTSKATDWAPEVGVMFAFR